MCVERGGCSRLLSALVVLSALTMLSLVVLSALTMLSLVVLSLCLIRLTASAHELPAGLRGAGDSVTGASSPQ